jgi:hypothetical protein
VELWRFVLEADREKDLADPERGEEWFRAQPWEVTSQNLVWTNAGADEWTLCIRSLRSLANRLGGVRLTRPDSFDPLVADGRAQAYLRKMQPTLERKANQVRVPLTPTTFRGVRLKEHVPQGSRCFEFETFFQRVFCSLFVPDFAPVCGDCGVDLPPTRGGRSSRRESCKRCQQRKAWDKKPLDGKRAVWREQYQRHRSKAAKSSEKTKKGK